MGIQGIYKEIGPGERIALAKLAVDKFEETGRPLRIAIDVSIWLFQVQASKGGTNPAPRTFYYRLLRLIALSIHPIFVFDGPDKPPFKRGKRTGANVSSIPDFLAKQLIKQFGFPIHYAPGEAEAECALLQREGIVDAVLSEDVDTLMFGSGLTLRNWSPELKTNKTPTHVSMYDAVKTKNGPSGLDREGMILVALMSGGDYVPEGIPGCGPKTACEAARAGFGRDLCDIDKKDRAAIRKWRERLQHELKTNQSKFFKRKHAALTIPDDFPRLDILYYYTNPIVSAQYGLETLRRSMKWDQAIDFPGLRSFTHDAFDWIRLEGAKHFIRSLAPSLLVRGLRMRAEGERFVSGNLEAIREDEALLVKGIHGKRQHLITDHSTELRVSFTPLELVKIDLSIEEPDDDISSEASLAPCSQPEKPNDNDLDGFEIDEEEEDVGVRKRGPTKFDPTKSARMWVMETFVKVGVPLTTQDWEAGLLRPRRAGLAKETTKAGPKATAAKRAKPTSNMPQSSIDQFAKVTKPGAKLSQTLAKAQSCSQRAPTTSKPSKHAARPVIDLIPSETRPTTNPLTQRLRDKSPSSVRGELSSSVTKRRRRAPMQRSRTLPVDLNPEVNRLLSPPPLSTVEVLDLVSSPTIPLPSQLVAKKAPTQPTKMSPITLTQRQTYVAASPGKSVQTTLDPWTRSSPAATPTKPRKPTSPVRIAPLPGPQSKTVIGIIDTLDLTVSSPPRSSSTMRSGQPGVSSNPDRTCASSAPRRPPLQSTTSNTSLSSTSSARSLASRPIFKGVPITRRASPHLRKLSTPTIDTLDLTQLSSPAASTSRVTSFTTETSCLPPPKTAQNVSASPPPMQASEQSLRRSPRNSTSPLESGLPGTSPPAAWKERKRKKREIHLRKSVAGAWEFKDATNSPAATDKGAELRGKERRKWRESEIEILDLVD